ncbi:hypothetical protein PR048_030315 [Dryococelus australis]|uniref:Uncharacterized protein n=1 Tax=Dryococelus australis TaxID=614101 RepID=A0ABQ9G8M4_9NEOP|nr:hypothetical protein PR048_030315 [Dryococelus australis]
MKLLCSLHVILEGKKNLDRLKFPMVKREEENERRIVCYLACRTLIPRANGGPWQFWSRGGLVVRLPASDRVEPGSIPCGVALGFPHAGRWVFLEDLLFHPPSYSGVVPYSPRFASVAPGLKTSMLTGLPTKPAATNFKWGINDSKLHCILIDMRDLKLHNIEVLRADEGDEVSMEQRRNDRAGETRDRLENPPTKGIVRRD